MNLAAGAEALAVAVRAGLDPQQVVEVVNASSGGSWIFADRMPRVLAGDFAPRAAAKILAKDVTIAAEFAARVGADATFANAARAGFQGMVEPATKMWTTRPSTNTWVRSWVSKPW